MKCVTRERLREILLSLDRPQPVGFIALVDAETKVTGNTLGGRLMKLARYSAWVGDYEGMVNNRREVEGKRSTFHARPRKWGHHLSMAVVHHVTKAGEERFYLSAQILRPTKPLYLVERLETHRRKTRRKLVAIAKEEIAHLLPASREPSHQGLDKVVVHRDIDLSHVTCASIGGEVYRVE